MYGRILPQNLQCKMCVIGQACVRFFPHPFVIPRKTCIFTPEFRRHSGGVRKDFIEKGVIEIIFLD